MQAFRRFPVQELGFTIRAETRLDLPHFPGYELHGFMERALKAVCCDDPGRACSTCLRRTDCPYRGLCAPSFPNLPGAGAMGTYPRPYVIRPSPAPRGGVSPGDTYRFSIVLVGSSAARAPYVIEAFEAAGRSGVLDRVSRFRVLSVRAGTPSGETGVFEDGRFLGLPPPLDIAPGKEAPPCREAALSILTPWCIPRKGSIVESAPPFALLVRALATRVCSLHRAYCAGPDETETPPAGKGEEPCPFGKKVLGCPDAAQCRALSDAAGGVEIADDATRFANPFRHRLRPGAWEAEVRKWARIGGPVGGVTYRGDLGPFVPLLQLGQAVHVGKMTTSGLGKYHLEC